MQVSPATVNAVIAEMESQRTMGFGRAVQLAVRVAELEGELAQAKQRIVDLEEQRDEARAERKRDD